MFRRKRHNQGAQYTYIHQQGPNNICSHTTELTIIIIIGVQPLGRFGQRPELSQATGIAVVRCILGKFLGVGCHYFPPN
jgi:hypothetical protein